MYDGFGKTGRERKWTISLFDYVENPRSLPGNIDVVYTVPCACAGVYRNKTCNQHGIGKGSLHWDPTARQEYQSAKTDRRS